MRSFARFLHPYLGRLAGSTALALAGTALDLARPWPLKLAVDSAIGGKRPTGLFAPLDGHSAATLAAIAAVIAVTLVAVGGIVDFFADYTVDSTAERIGADLRAAVFARLQRLSLRFHDRNRTGDLVNRLTSDVSRVQDALVAVFETLLPALLTLVGMVVLVMLIDPTLGLVALVFVPLLAIVVTFLRRRLKRVQRETRTLYGALASRATDTLRNVRVVQAFAREDLEQKRFREQSDAMMNTAVGAARIEATYSPVSDLVLALGSGLVLWLGVLQVRSGALTVGTLLVLLTYVSGVYRPIRSLARLASTLAKASVSRERLTEIIESQEHVAESDAPLAAPSGAPTLALRDLSFSYDGARSALSDVSFEVDAGETVCIVGPSGSGKSTLLSLLLRLYDADDGAIEYGGVDLRRIGLASLRERIALVPQDPWILDGTIAENIAFGRHDATLEDVRWASHLALVDEFVDRLPQRYETHVGEGGALLSGGQRRRLALARAIVRGASVLVLDEPTTGLDASAEAEVLTALQRVSRGRTTVIAAHALAIARLSDRVLVLEHGRLVEQGSHDDLVCADGRYAHMWEVQRNQVPISFLPMKGGVLDDAYQGSAQDDSQAPWQEPRRPRRLEQHDEHREHARVRQHRIGARRAGRDGDTIAAPARAT